MTNQHNDGGPAFPREVRFTGNTQATWKGAHVPPGARRDGPRLSPTTGIRADYQPSDVARDAHMIADAMIAEGAGE